MVDIRAAGDGMGGVVESTGLADIAKAVGELDAITQRNAQMVDDASQQAGSLKERSALLSAAVAHFRLMQGTAGAARA